MKKDQNRSECNRAKWQSCLCCHHFPVIPEMVTFPWRSMRAETMSGLTLYLPGRLVSTIHCTPLSCELNINQNCYLQATYIHYMLSSLKSLFRQWDLLGHSFEIIAHLVCHSIPPTILICPTFSFSKNYFLTNYLVYLSHLLFSVLPCLNKRYSRAGIFYLCSLMNLTHLV